MNHYLLLKAKNRVHRYYANTHLVNPHLFKSGDQYLHHLLQYVFFNDIGTSSCSNVLCDQ